MPSKDTKVLEFNQYQKSDKAPFVIYADLECIIEKRLMDVKIIVKICLKICFSMFTISSFRSIEKKHDLCRGEDCIKKFSKFSRKHAIKIINFNEKKMKFLTKEQ